MQPTVMLTADQVNPRLQCPVCGTGSWCSLPIPLAIFLAALRAFLTTHQPCGGQRR